MSVRQTVLVVESRSTDSEIQALHDKFSVLIAFYSIITKNAGLRSSCNLHKNVIQFSLQCLIETLLPPITA